MHNSSSDSPNIAHNLNYITSMAKEKEKDKNMSIGLIWKANYAKELKFFLIVLLFLSSLFSIFQLLPSHFFLSVSDIPPCTPTPTLLPPPPSPHQDQILENGSIKRAFNPYGRAAYNFILMSAYRGGANTFAVTGLSSKPVQLFTKPSYLCEYVPNKNLTAITTTGYKILPDWGYGRIYTTIVINCTFPVPVGDNSGGKLLIHASTNGGNDTIEALYEPENSLNMSLFSGSPKYDYLYCGSSLFGNLSPQRVREWISYHVRLFGEKSHFVLYDAGGVHDGVMDVLLPWIEKGYVTVNDIREQERFDGYYHNQFLVVNDCLHKYRFMAKWVFFFDVDEFIYVPDKGGIKSVVDEFENYTQFTIVQRTMSNKLCVQDDDDKSSRKWGFEKLVFRDIKRGIRRDRKYAVQPRSVFATGVHISQNYVGRSTHKTEGRIAYYHYHGTISERREPCRKLSNAADIVVEGIPYVVDLTVREVATAVKKFEVDMIGSRLQNTRQ